MKKLITFISLFCCIFGFAEISAQNNQLQKSIDAVLQNKFFNRAQISINAIDLLTGEEIYSFNSQKLFRPASVQKLFTTAAAIKFLGTERKFKTAVYTDGTLQNKTLTGNLFIKGGFDPDFNTNNLDTLIAQLFSSGITRITGNIYADVSMMDSLFWGEGWMWDDDPYSFAAYFSPLSINDNSIKIIVEPIKVGKKPLVRTDPETEILEIQNSATVNRGYKNRLSVSRKWLNRSNKITIRGSIGVRAKNYSTTVNIFNPTLYFLELFKERCISAGITISGKLDTLKTPVNVWELANHECKIDKIINNVNKTSDNLSAELLLRSIPYHKTGDKSGAVDGKKYVERLISFLDENPESYSIVDGSGLSYYNLTSTALTGKLLQHMYYSSPESYSLFYNSLSVSGIDGTLRNRLNSSELRGKVRGKTGSLRGTTTLSGYLQTETDKNIAFSIFIQNFTGNQSKPKNLIDEIVRLIYKHY
ncbi:MAG: D-alanyl-D-alanine carboxypeptidase/D-alanyl-D-alanine-endopeptidase [Melioribacteraceae bacterium]|nr:D-alanyl-D-alanine carboxypeptidase/D-alanyl-D-alanine-endopeptidase [Melioribacteraceae bacterium]